jgi:hypothetical protein
MEISNLINYMDIFLLLYCNEAMYINTHAGQQCDDGDDNDDNTTI